MQSIADSERTTTDTARAGISAFASTAYRREKILGLPTIDDALTRFALVIYTLEERAAHNTSETAHAETSPAAASHHQAAAVRILLDSYRLLHDRETGSNYLISVPTSKARMLHHQLVTSWLAKPLDSLREYAAMGPNWDSYNADEIEVKALETARSLLSSLHARYGDILADRLQPSLVAPLADGGIQLEWDTEAKSLELEITPEGAISILAVARSNGQRKSTTKKDAAPSEALLAIVRTLI